MTVKRLDLLCWFILLLLFVVFGLDLVLFDAIVKTGVGHGDKFVSKIIAFAAVFIVLGQCYAAWWLIERRCQSIKLIEEVREAFPGEDPRVIIEKWKKNEKKNKKAKGAKP